AGFRRLCNRADNLAASLKGMARSETGPLRRQPHDCEQLPTNGRNLPGRKRRLRIHLTGEAGQIFRRWRRSAGAAAGGSCELIALVAMSLATGKFQIRTLATLMALQKA